MLFRSCAAGMLVIGCNLKRGSLLLKAILTLYFAAFLCGGFWEVIAMSACTDSNYASQYQLPGTFAPTASYELVARAVEVAKEQGTPVRVGSVVSSDAFYGDNPESSKAWRKMGVLCVEMECAALFMNAARAGKEALGILTISDHVFRDEAISAEARQTSFNRMMEIALGI